MISSSIKSDLNSFIKAHKSQQKINKKYKNVMETLVWEELEKQLSGISPKVSQYIKPHEVAAFALNRLPALYATNQRGWAQQWKVGQSEYSNKITICVKQAIIAVQKDFLRDDFPLDFDDELAAFSALDDLKALLQRQHLTWENVVDVVEESLLDTVRGKITWRKPKNTEIFDWEKHPQHQH